MVTKREILTDAEIIEGLTGRRPADEAIRCLYSAFFEGAGRFVVANSGSWQDAEDIFQEVVVAFIHLVRQNRFRGESSIKTFLFSLNRNMWLNELKRRGRSKAREEKYEAARPAEEEQIGKVVEGREATEGLMNLFGELGDHCKTILLMFYYENRSMKEILAELPYENEQVVRNKKHKCLKKLEQMILGNAGLYHQLKNLLHG
jgi:RNA polymerase sigma factor (sigma-70 family)